MRRNIRENLKWKKEEKYHLGLLFGGVSDYRIWLLGLLESTRFTREKTLASKCLFIYCLPMIGGWTDDNSSNFTLEDSSGVVHRLGSLA